MIIHTCLVKNFLLRLVLGALEDFMARSGESCFCCVAAFAVCKQAIGLHKGVLINGRSDIRGKISWHFVREGSVSLPPGIMNDMNVTKSY